MTSALLIFLAAISAVWLGRLIVRACTGAFSRLSRHALFALSVLAVACTVCARKGHIAYPATDPATSYLRDDGSFVTNDLVHVSFTRIIVPDTATLCIDRRPVSREGDDSAWTSHIETTFAEFRVPQDIGFAAATNWDWVVYTTWTPGPSVLTNGVWHAMWGKDRKMRRHFIPLRTCVRVDGQVIATPKSKEDSNE